MKNPFVGVLQQFELYKHNRFISMWLQRWIQEARRKWWKNLCRCEWMPWNSWSLPTKVYQLLGIVSMCLRNWIPFERKQSNMRRCNSNDKLNCMNYNLILTIFLFESFQILTSAKFINHIIYAWECVKIPVDHIDALARLAISLVPIIDRAR